MTFCETCKELINTGCFSILIRCWLLSFKGYCLLHRNVQLQMCIIPQRLKCVAFVLPKEKSGRIWPWFLMLNMQHIDLPLFCRGVPLLRMKNALGTLLTNPIPIPKYSSLLWYKDVYICIYIYIYIYIHTITQYIIYILCSSSLVITA